MSKTCVTLQYVLIFVNVSKKNTAVHCLFILVHISLNNVNQFNLWF